MAPGPQNPILLIPKGFRQNKETEISEG